VIPQQGSFATRLGRLVIGFGLGNLWGSVVSVFWIAALAAGYGSLDRGLMLFKDEWWSPIGAAAFFGSIVGSLVGGMVGPVALRVSRNRSSSILGSSLLGAATGAVLAASVGVLVG
jgi:hypothetical protein